MTGRHRGHGRRAGTYIVLGEPSVEAVGATEGIAGIGAGVDEILEPFRAGYDQPDPAEREAFQRSKDQAKQAFKDRHDGQDWTRNA